VREQDVQGSIVIRQTLNLAVGLRFDL